jgi:hypothetical protein
VENLCGEEEIHLQIFLNSALSEGEWSLLLPEPFIPEEGDPGALLIGGWVDISSNLNEAAKRVIFL